MFAFFKTSPTFDFASNILANVTQLKDGREFIIEANLVKQILALAQDTNHTSKHRRKQLIFVLRNVCFEYAKYEADFV